MVISKEKLKEILARLVQYPTENPPGKTDTIINYLLSEIFEESEGFINEIIEYQKNGISLQNLVTKIGFGKDKIILCGHFDVVPAGNPQLWRYPPFSAEVVEGKMFGRGAADMKAGLTMLIGTMMNLKENSKFLEKYTLVFLGTADEEAGMTGALTSVKRGIMDNSILLIIAEPTDMHIGVAEKGLLWAKLNIYGKSAHGSTPYLGINSIDCALNLIPKIYGCIDKTKNEILKNSTINVSKIQGGSVINIVPDKTTLEVDIRLIPEHNLKQLIKKLKNIDASPCRLEVKITKTLPALQTTSSHPFLQNLKKLNKTEIIGLPYATDGAILVNSKNPVPFVIYGPGDPNVVHKENEYVKIENVYKSTEYLTKALLQTYS